MELFMASSRTQLRRRLKGLYRDLRGAREVLRAMASTDHPFLAHIIPKGRADRGNVPPGG